MSYGDARVRRHRDGARYTGYDLERNPSFRKCYGFLTPAAKNEGITALQAAYGLSLASLFDHQPLDMFLVEALFAGFLTHVGHFGVWTRFFEQMQIDEPIVQDHIRFPETH